MPRLYLMRHGQTEFNVQQLVQGRCDSPLTDLGIAQARGHQPNDGKGVIGAHREQTAVVIEELERCVYRAPRTGERTRILKQRRLDGKIAPGFEARSHAGGDFLAHLRLFGQDIPDPHGVVFMRRSLPPDAPVQHAVALLYHSKYQLRKERAPGAPRL